RYDDVVGVVDLGPGPAAPVRAVAGGAGELEGVGRDILYRERPVGGRVPRDAGDRHPLAVLQAVGVARDDDGGDAVAGDVADRGGNGPGAAARVGSVPGRSCQLEARRRHVLHGETVVGGRVPVDAGDGDALAVAELVGAGDDDGGDAVPGGVRD